MASLTLRPGAPTDHEALLSIWRAAVEATHHFLSSRDIEELERLIAEVYLGAVRLTVAEHDGALAGFVGVAPAAESEAADGDGDAGSVSIEMLFVHPDAHGRGVGTALLEAVAAGHAVALVDVNEQNPQALGFYLARGFVQVGRSATDGEGRPFPLLHLRRVHEAA